MQHFLSRSSVVPSFSLLFFKETQMSPFKAGRHPPAGPAPFSRRCPAPSGLRAARDRPAPHHRVERRELGKGARGEGQKGGPGGPVAENVP